MKQSEECTITAECMRSRLNGTFCHIGGVLPPQTLSSYDSPVNASDVCRACRGTRATQLAKECGALQADRYTMMTGLHSPGERRSELVKCTPGRYSMPSKMCGNDAY